MNTMSNGFAHRPARSMSRRILRLALRLCCLAVLAGLLPPGRAAALPAAASPAPAGTVVAAPAAPSAGPATVEAGSPLLAPGAAEQIADGFAAQSPVAPAAPSADHLYAYVLVAPYSINPDPVYKVRIIDFTDAPLPKTVGEYAIREGKISSYSRMALYGSFLYIAGPDLIVLDVSDPANPLRAAWIADVLADGTLSDMAVSGGRAVFSFWELDGPYGLKVFDISNPYAPALQKTILSTNQVWDVALNGDMAYVIGNVAGNKPEGVWIVNLDSEAQYQYNRPYNSFSHIDVSGATLWAAVDRTLRAFDVSNPAAVVETQNVSWWTNEFGDEYYKLIAQPPYLYLNSHYVTALRFNISSGIVPAGEYRQDVGMDIAAAGGLLFATHWGSDLYALGGSDPTKLNEVGRYITPNRYELLTLAAAGSGLPVVEPPDLSIRKLEVRQVTLAASDPQAGETIPLIAGKPTWVRVYLNSARQSHYDRLRVRIHARLPSGTEYTQDRVLVNYNVPPASTGDGWESSVNFLVNQPDLSGATVIWAEVDPLNAIEESNEANNLGAQAAYNFAAARPLRIGVAPLNDLANKRQAGTDVLGIASFARQVYPLAEIEIVPLPSVDVNFDPTDGKLDGVLFEALHRIHNAVNMGADQPMDLLYGALPLQTRNGGNSDAHIDNGQVSGTVALGGFSPQKMYYSAQIFAHEIAHLLGRTHPRYFALPGCGNPNPFGISDWPYADHRIQQTGVNPSGRLFDPDLAVDYMSYCWTEAIQGDEDPEYTQNLPTWTSPWTFNRLLDRLQSLSAREASRPAAVSAGSRALVTDGGALKPDAPYVSYISVTGQVPASGAAEIGSVAYYTTAYPVEPTPPGSQYCLEVFNASNMVFATSCFDLAATSFESGAAIDSAAFNLLLPMPEWPYRVRLTSPGSRVDEWVRDGTPPAVTVLYPNGGETLDASAPISVTWQATDAGGSALTYDLYLLTQNDAVSTPIAAGLTGTSYTIPAGRLPGDPAARLSVFVRDGLYTFADGSDTTFALLPPGPQAAIYWPQGGDRLPAGLPVSLEGGGYDADDGALSGTACAWTVDGKPLSQPCSASLELAVGTHRAVLTVSDSSGAQAQAEVRFTVGTQLFLPVMNKNSGTAPPGPIMLTLPGRPEDARLSMIECPTWSERLAGRGANLLYAGLAEGSITRGYYNSRFHNKLNIIYSHTNSRFSTYKSGR